VTGRIHIRAVQFCNAVYVTKITNYGHSNIMNSKVPHWCNFRWFGIRFDSVVS